MSCHSFDIEDAKKYGVEPAVILFNLRFWITHNAANKTHQYDGYTWTYNSAKAFAELFPYWTDNKIKKMLKKLEKDGVIITGNYNRAGYDRTKWYTLPEFAQKTDKTAPQPPSNLIGRNGPMEKAISPNGKGQTASPIPDINTDITTDSKITDHEQQFVISQLDRDSFPNCHNAIEALKAFESINSGAKVYLGALKLSEWEECELNMNSVDFEIDYLFWWMKNKANGMRKTPSLPNMLPDTINGIPFEQFYLVVSDEF